MQRSIPDRAAGMYFARIDKHQLVAGSCMVPALTIEAVGTSNHQFYYIVIMEMPRKAMVTKCVTGKIDVEEIFAPP